EGDLESALLVPHDPPPQGERNQVGGGHRRVGQVQRLRTDQGVALDEEIRRQEARVDLGSDGGGERRADRLRGFPQGGARSRVRGQGGGQLRGRLEAGGGVFRHQAA